MKNLICFLTLLISILNVSDNLVNAQAMADEVRDAVLDMDGNELKTGANYYVVPTFRPGGGVTITYPIANKTCTAGVAQLSVIGDGLPVTFANGGTDGGEVVRESTDLTISFADGLLLCPTVWRMGEYDAEAQDYFVIAGENETNEDTINNRFQIRKDLHGSDYRFAFCPKPRQFFSEICPDVGIYVNEEGLRRFALNQNFPSTFVFKKF